MNQACILSGSLLLALTTTSGSADASSPASPKVDDHLCPTQVLAAAVYRDAPQSIQVYEPSPVYTLTPAEMAYGERKVKVADGYVEFEIIPATFKEVTEEIEVERERVEIETQPATYRTEIKQILTRPAAKRWNPACKPAQGEQATDIPANCLLEVPAEYTEIKRQVIDVPASISKKTIPGKTIKVTHKVLVEPAHIVRKEVAPVYESVRLTRIDKPTRTTTTPQPARYQTIMTQQPLRPQGIAQMPALCEAEAKPESIQALQRRLQQLSYYKGSIQGRLDTPTREAVTRYQQENGLATGAITLETLRKLQLR